nr:T9SS type A sorting domain-containing protein [uncultured Carboxylicivirga sp.]
MKTCTLTFLLAFFIIQFFYGQSLISVSKHDIEKQQPPTLQKSDLKLISSNKPRLELERIFSLAGEEWIYGNKYEYEYYETDDLKKSVLYYRPSESAEWTLDEMNEFEYDLLGNKTMETYMIEGDSQDRYINSYNENNFLSEQIIQHYINSDWVNSKQSIYAFNESDYPISVTTNYWNSDTQAWEYGCITTYVLDSENRIVEEVTLDLDTNADGVINANDHMKIVYTYDNSRLILTEWFYKTEEGEWFSSRKTERTFENDKLVSINGYYRDGGADLFKLNWTETWDYDEYGNPFSFTVSDLDDEEWYSTKTEYEYDYNESVDDYVIPPIGIDVSFINKITGITFFVQIEGVYKKVRYAELYYTGEEVPTSLVDKLEEKMRVISHDGYIQVLGVPTSNDYLLTLYDVNGVIIKKISINDQQNISTLDIKPGLYLYQFQNSKRNLNVGKIIIR